MYPAHRALLLRLSLLCALSLALLCSTASAAVPVRLTANASASNNPAIATGVDGLSRIVWSDTRDGNSEIYYALVDAFGNRLTSDVRVTTTPTVSSTVPKVGVDGQGYAYICWRESNNVWLVKLDRLGNIQVSARAVALGFSYVITLGPDISVQSDGRFAVGLGAQRSGLNDVFVVNYDAGLNKLCQTSNLYTNVTFLDSKLSVSTSGNLNTRLAWQQVGYLDGDNLATVGSAVNCSRSAVSYLCSGTNFVHMNNHGAGLLYQRSNKVYLAGAGCGTQLSESPGPSISPTGDTLSRTTSIAVWDDRRSGNADLYFAVYANTGLAKLGVDSVLVSGASASQTPAVSSDRAGTAFVAWQDDRDSNAEIYFARNPDLSAYRGTIVGLVSDAITLAPIPGAIVTVIGPQPGDGTRDIVAGSDGRYRVAGLAPGLYALSASSAGHASPHTSGVTVSAGGTVTVDLRVSTGSVLEGGVSDASSELAIGGAKLHLVSADQTYVRDTETTPEGYYHLDLPPGTYSLTVTVPALGVPGPYFSTAHDLYVPQTLASITVGANAPPRHFALQTNTVVLAHGIRSNAEMWGVVASPVAGNPVMRSQLETAGYHTEAMDRDWTRSIPEQGLELQRWFGQQRFKSAYIVAHSMGGLASRWYIERVHLDGGADRIPVLVTLGTPNHGAPAASDVSDFLDLFPGVVEVAQEAVHRTLDMTQIQFETLLLQKWTFLDDLRPNNANLNRLNYGDPDYFDMPSRFACLDHDPEQVPLAHRYVAIAGDRPQWYTTLWAEVPCSSDGVVPVASSKLFKSGSVAQRIQAVRTSCLPDPIGTLDCGCAHTGLLGSVDYARSYCVARNVLTVLTGADIAPTCAIAPYLPSAVAPDTALQLVGDHNHRLSPGASAVDSFLVDSGDYLSVRVRWMRGGLRLSLRSPSGIVVDSAATLGNPNRLFVSSYPNHSARLDVANAEPGWWRIACTLTSDSTQMVSVRSRVSGSVTLDPVLTPSQAPVGSAVVVRARLRAGGVALMGATVTADVRSPLGDSTQVSLHDDGMAPDSTAGDGSYGAALPATTAPGRHIVTVRAAGGVAPPYAPRSARTVHQALATPTVSVADLAHGTLWGNPSDPLVFDVTVRNSSPVAGDSVWVTGRDDSTGVAFLDTVITLPALGSRTLTTRFSATRLGLHPLTFSAVVLAGDPGATPQPVSRVVEIVSFGGTPTVVSAEPTPRVGGPAAYIPSRSVPNPTHGASTITFSLPHATPWTRLTVIDATGRQVSREDLGALAAGPQRLVWRANRIGGRALQPGVYFYRIEARGAVGQGRFVVVR